MALVYDQCLGPNEGTIEGHSDFVDGSVILSPQGSLVQTLSRTRNS